MAGEARYGGKRYGFGLVQYGRRGSTIRYVGAEVWLNKEESYEKFNRNTHGDNTKYRLYMSTGSLYKLSPEQIDTELNRNLTVQGNKIYITMRSS